MITVQYLSLQPVMFTRSQLCKILHHSFSYFKHLIYFTDDFSIFKINKSRKTMARCPSKYVFPFSGNRDIRHGFAQEHCTSKPSKLYSGQVTNSSQRNIIKACVFLGALAHFSLPLSQNTSLPATKLQSCKDRQGSTMERPRKYGVKVKM